MPEHKQRKTTILGKHQNGRRKYAIKYSDNQWDRLRANACAKYAECYVNHAGREPNQADTQKVLDDHLPMLANLNKVHAETDKLNYDALARLAGSITTPDQYKSIIVPAARGMKIGADEVPDDMPPEQLPNFVQSIRNRGLDVDKQNAQENAVWQQKLDEHKQADIEKQNAEKNKIDWYNATNKNTPAAGGGTAIYNGTTSLSPADEKNANDLAFAKLDPNTFLRLYSKYKGSDKLMREVQLRAETLNPDFNMADATADFASYKNNFQRTQMSNLIRAESLLDTYQGLSDAVRRNDVTLFNKLGNNIGLNLSDINKTNLQTMQTVMTEDLSRALTQSGVSSDAKMKMAGNIADVMDLSNPAASEKIKIIHEVINANKKGIRSNWGDYGKNDKATSPDKTSNSFVAGKTYTDAKGNKAVYQADGSWKEIQ